MSNFTPTFDEYNILFTLMLCICMCTVLLLVDQCIYFTERTLKWLLPRVAKPGVETALSEFTSGNKCC